MLLYFENLSKRPLKFIQEVRVKDDTGDNYEKF